MSYENYLDTMEDAKIELYEDKWIFDYCNEGMSGCPTLLCQKDTDNGHIDHYIVFSLADNEFSLETVEFNMIEDIYDLVGCPIAFPIIDDVIKYVQDKWRIKITKDDLEPMHTSLKHLLVTEKFGF